jgi:hypothetical protein
LNSQKAFTDFSAFEIGRSSDLIGFHGICAPPSYALDQQKLTETNLFFGQPFCVMHHNPTSYRLGRSFMGHCPIRRPSAVHESVVSRFESWKGKEDVPWEHHGTTSSGWWFGTWIIMVNLWFIMTNNWNNNISGWW